MRFPGIQFGEIKWFHIFRDEAKTDPRVRMRLLDLGVVASNYGKMLIITGITRSKEKNIEIYGEDRASGHRELPARAIDFVVTNPDADFAARLKNHHAMYMDNGAYFTLMSHDAGSGKHWHLQVPHDPRINKKLYSVA